MRKKILISALAAITLIAGFSSGLGLISSATSASGNYKAADYAIIGNKQVLVAANQNGLEIFEVQNNSIRKASEVKLTNFDSFPNGLFIRQEGENYYVYAAGGAEIFRADITSIYWPAIVARYNLGQTVYDLKAMPGYQNIMAAGAFGLKELESKNLSPARNLWTGAIYGLSINSQGNMIANTQTEALMFDKYLNLTKREYLEENSSEYRQPYIDEANRAFTFSASSLKRVSSNLSFDNWSGFGYAVDGAKNDVYVYAVNGWGVYKLDKNLNLQKFATINQKAGWAKGVKAVSTSDGLRVIVLASDRIYLLNDSLDILSSYTYQPAPNARVPMPGEPTNQITIAAATSNYPLKVTLNKFEAKAKSLINAYGYGYWPGEPVTVSIGELKAKSLADYTGNILASNLLVPAQTVYPAIISVTIDGDNSHLSYSTTLKVLEPEPAAETFEYLPAKAETHNETVRETTRTETKEGDKTIIKETVTEKVVTVTINVVALEISGGKINKNRVEIDKNVTVRFVNKDAENRTVKSITAPEGKSFASPELKQNETYEVLFDASGMYEYAAMANPSAEQIAKIKVR